MKQALLLLALTGLMSAADNRPADEKAVRASVAQFNELAHKGDGAALDKLLSADLMYSHSNAKVESKAECIAAIVKSKPNFVMDPGLDVKIYGNTAVVHSKMVANNITNGTPTKVALDVIQVWVKTGGSWQMVARHTTRLPV
ncbi:MAG: nuclear transport factor 2 family protein [Acidobacteriia bacterium]|nr:nuclear transport factor 2 family protein [Terriglobia bacterium]